MVKDEKAVLWAECIQELRSSEQTIKEWCIEHKISYSIMEYWMRKFEGKEKETENALVIASCHPKGKLPRIRLQLILLHFKLSCLKIFGVKYWILAERSFGRG